MTLPEEKTSRFKHFRASLSRQSRGRGKDTLAIIALTLIAIALTLWVFTQQKASLPSWAPLVGEDFAHLTADFTSAQAVTPGQGQAVVIAGVKVGKISTVELEDGHAVVGLDVEPKYLKLIHPDATLLLRPKTNLNDMAIEIEPGKKPGHVEDGFNFPLAQTQPNVNLDAFFATLDKDTQQYLQLLVASGSQGIGDRAHQLSGAFRRLEPFAHYIAKLNEVVAERHQALAGAIHHFSQLTTELGRHDRQIERFVTSSQAALGNFANQQESIQQALIEFPQALTTLKSALASSNSLSLAARPALLGLIPQAEALGPAFARHRAILRTDDRADREPDPALHPRSPAGRPAHQAGRGAAQQVGHRVRQRGRRPQQLLQPAGLQAEGEGRLPLLRALGAAQPQCGLSPGLHRPGPAGAGDDHLRGDQPRERDHRKIPLPEDDLRSGPDPAGQRNPADPT